MIAHVLISLCLLMFQVYVLWGLHILACEWTERPLHDCAGLFDIVCRFHRLEFMVFFPSFQFIYIFPE